jgi:hypothetical protein
MIATASTVQPMGLKTLFMKTLLDVGRILLCDGG